MAAQYGIAGTTAKTLSASIERAVTDGTLAPGAALPPVRRLAEDLGISRRRRSTARGGCGPGAARG
ncbi:GntR family transcriptional regulator, partial [Streptomyces sp. NPDC029704]|uniref:GntR family transcriptional regulator n=1 Tax=Streptomyces sp. NPDC029704 TaxID=3156920 RepID=UPI0033E46B5D